MSLLPPLVLNANSVCATGMPTINSKMTFCALFRIFIMLRNNCPKCGDSQLRCTVLADISDRLKWGNTGQSNRIQASGHFRPILAARRPGPLPKTFHSRTAAFGEWRRLLCPQYQTLERLLSGYDGVLLLTQSSRSFLQPLTPNLEEEHGPI